MNLELSKKRVSAVYNKIANKYHKTFFSPSNYLDDFLKYIPKKLPETIPCPNCNKPLNTPKYICEVCGIQITLIIRPTINQ